MLDKYYEGVVPDKADKLLEVQNSVSAKYRNALYSADGLRRVENCWNSDSYSRNWKIKASQ